MAAEKRKKRRRGGSYSLQYSVIAFIAFTIFGILSVTVFFKINSVSIRGTSIYTADEIVAASGLKSGDNLVRKNMKKCSEMITGELVYIETAEVRRVFPSTVRITVAPAEEKANMEHDGVWYLTSAEGKILDISNEGFNNSLITFYGTDAAPWLKRGVLFESEDERKTENIFELLEKTKESVLADSIKSIDVTDRLKVICNFEDRISIVLGSVAEIDYKLRYADRIIRLNIGADEEGTLTFHSESASFISRDGIIRNQETYLQNLDRLKREEVLSSSIIAAENGNDSENFE